MTEEVAETIDCIECGGKAHLLLTMVEIEELTPGTPIAYRCADCLDRFDVVYE